MKCPNCNSTVPESSKYCPYCDQVISTASPTSEAEVSATPLAQKDLIKGILTIATILVAIFLVFTLGKLIFENSGGYDISGYGFSNSYEITYHGRLSKLSSDDYDLLEDFIYKQKVSGKSVIHLVCNDYTLTHCEPGDLGTADICEEYVTVYEEGLDEYTVTNEYSKRFFDDFIFCIEELDSGHEFYFYSLSDVEDWIANRT